VLRFSNTPGTNTQNSTAVKISFTHMFM
jgi:hypothetical protein